MDVGLSSQRVLEEQLRLLHLPTPQKRQDQDTESPFIGWYSQSFHFLLRFGHPGQVPPYSMRLHVRMDDVMVNGEPCGVPGRVDCFQGLNVTELSREIHQYVVRDGVRAAKEMRGAERAARGAWGSGMWRGRRRRRSRCCRSNGSQGLQIGREVYSGLQDSPRGGGLRPQGRTAVGRENKEGEGGHVPPLSLHVQTYHVIAVGLDQSVESH
ncbi:hypothetical protein NGA_0233501 [Nannochloropsis gaditana CCMP526]|uniref:uncharacterized protein n=1 Tax=Nannochloropsis gaditana (strain CCMP526) TaxID=1093141 RepID=UPI00029F75DA|nr:hypothetical protein NGA_0233501 [Nannochloropsis gaditana CCMP526]XP_005854722.1 hypothetical protein NGA_0233502 [Nannochloropsis gaditana CCMP526]EKU21635.1 hypothetical protein NGA_0233502 [Nannochloropsis gaditana CCMP526]EKU21795.1 hypothetical protein NGA_0233501 [Nannochloropsis gaditana CCMP526]|eukprot:XP_005854564.1 hypothetical protein NGA_0233501 [Nannochloropsis gaditana CCMP526]